MQKPALLLALLSLGCGRAAPELDPAPKPSAEVASEVAPLRWDAPPMWTVLDVPRTGPKKAAYRVPRAGSALSDGEVEVVFHGTGTAGDVERNVAVWLAQFDVAPGTAPKRSTTKASAMRVEVLEVSGTYKLDLMPKVGPRKRAPAQAVRKNHRLLGAAVVTPDRGTWFFKLVGPDDTVQATRSAFLGMVESAR